MKSNIKFSNSEIREICSGLKRYSITPYPIYKILLNGIPIKGPAKRDSWRTFKTATCAAKKLVSKNLINLIDFLAKERFGKDYYEYVDAYRDELIRYLFLSKIIEVVRIN